MTLKIDNSRVENPHARYTENAQRIPLRFQICERDGDTIFPLHKSVMCRDYFSDWLIWSKGELPRKKAIHGFMLQKDMPLDKLRLLTSYYPLNAAQCLDINKFEEDNNIPKSTFEDVGSCVYIEADPFWLKTTIHLSYYTLLLRIAASNTADIPLYDRAANTDRTMIDACKRDAFIKVLKSLNITKVCGGNLEYIEDDWDLIHAYSGCYTPIYLTKYSHYGEQVKSALSSL